MEFSSKLLSNAVDEISRLPGIGKRSALRLALYLLKQPKEDTSILSKTLEKLRNEIDYCSKCHNLSEKKVCEICSNEKRNKKLICVVEDIRDVMAIESTNQYNGLYHVLGGIISPIEGIGPNDLKINSLVEKVKSKEVNELILALSSTLEADTTNFYIYKNLSEYEIKITTIARGISVGDELEYADEITLGRSILKRVPYESSISQ
ncbi:MAG: recombination protein RecR [Flavobacteriales bacterium]|jgi:recombination protein RecR|nr:recombination protein RecR [Flavobacteriaceae bacterium]MBQ22538.1 recombination protein RecR [Flavobacteriales bacterium]|tara:strand:- start:16599 stop:17216 length:618 start_codon:yes stop_codon:yes gene_type:complete